ncbi:MAG: ribonuclease HII [bacterium]
MEIDLKKYEKDLYKQGYKYIAGTDEAGRGPLAGDVVAAAVILPEDFELEGLNDSKKLSAKKRDLYYDIIIKECLAYSVEIVSAEKIDEINIYEASRLAMNNALDKLEIMPDYILSDAMPLKRENSLPIIHGDALSLTIAAASVIAKVTRDRMMEELDEKYPQYGFKKHKGYGTKMHLEMIREHGILDIHRKSYKPVKEEYEKGNIYKGE